jgi:hypothetical protein
VVCGIKYKYRVGLLVCEYLGKEVGILYGYGLRQNKISKEANITYPSSSGFRSNGHRPRSTNTGSLGTAIHPYIMVLMTVAGSSVPVAACIIRHI